MLHLTSRRLTLLISGTLAVLSAGIALPQTAHAQITFFTDRTTFTTANPGLTAEGFEASTGGTDRVINGAIDSTTSGTTLLAVVSGLRVQVVGTTGVPGTGANQFFYNNRSPFNTGNGTHVLNSNSSVDSQDISLLSGTANAFGTDLGGSNGGSGGNLYTISVFDTAGVLLGSTTATPAANTFGFFGVTSVQNIGRVNIATIGFEITDNMLFGRTASTSSAAAEPGTLALLLTGTLPVAGMIARRRRKAA